MHQLTRIVWLQAYKFLRRKYYFGLILSGVAFFFTKRYEPQKEVKYYHILTEGCKIPFMEVFDEELHNITYDPNDFIKPCSNFTILLYNSSHIWIEIQLVQMFNVTYDSIHCCYQPFEQTDTIDDIYAPERERKVQYKPCQNFTDFVTVSSEFAKVSCHFVFRNHSKNNLSQFFIFTPTKNTTTSLSLSAHNITSHREYGYNVIILGFNGMSRMNFYRTMAGTFDYLYSKDSVELQGYHKVSDDTNRAFPNMMPMLLGLRESEMKRTCWPHMNAHYDNCPFIWTQFKNFGYNTALGDDCSFLNLFNYQRYGFIKSPTDYYMYPFVKEVTKKIEQTNTCNICMGNRYFYQVLIDYIKNLTITLKGSKLFGFFWETCMSHEYFPVPELMDEYYLDLIKEMENSQYLNDTILIITSNSGMLWGEIRYSARGRLEEQLPVMQILLPSSFRKIYNLAYRNLIANKYKLTTPFDVYETLKDLVNLNYIKNENIERRSLTVDRKSRGISLFLNIPTSRSCADVNLEGHECACENVMAQDIKVNSMIARRAATFLIEQVNSLLQGYLYCAQLTLVKIMRISVIKRNPLKYFDVVLVLRPDLLPSSIEAEYISTKYYYEIKATLSLENRKNWTLVGDFHRTNAITRESLCLDDKIDKKYRDVCYCYDFIF